MLDEKSGISVSFTVRHLNHITREISNRKRIGLEMFHFPSAGFRDVMAQRRNSRGVSFVCMKGARVTNQNGSCVRSDTFVLFPFIFQGKTDSTSPTKFIPRITEATTL
jgi:hypothetical protein